MYKIVREKAAPVRQVRQDLPEILDKITQKALAMHPNERYQTSGDFAYDLRVALRGLEGSANATDRMEDIIDYARSVSFFEGFGREQVKEILDASNVIKVRRGQVVVSEGEIDDSFYILLSGRTVVRKGEKDIAVIGRGECFRGNGLPERKAACGHGGGRHGLHPDENQRHVAGSFIQGYPAAVFKKFCLDLDSPALGE